MSDFKIQRGTATIAISGTTVTITAGTEYTAPASLSRAKICIRGPGYYGTQADARTNLDTATASIDNPANLLTSITFSRGTTSASTGVTVDWEIVEYIGASGGGNEFIVRGQELLAYGSASNTVSGSAIATVASNSRVMVEITSQSCRTSGAPQPGNLFSTAAWNTGTTKADFTRVRAGVCVTNVSYALVEYVGSNWSNVQRVSHTFTANGVQEDVTITDFGTMNVRGHFQWTPSNIGAGSNQATIQGWLSASNTASFKTDSGANSDLSAVGVLWVVANTQTGTGAPVVRRYTGTNSTSSNNVAIAVTAVADLTQTSLDEISESNTQPSGSGTTFSFSLKPTSTTNVRMWAIGTIGTTTYRFATFEWPTAPAASGVTPLVDGYLVDGQLIDGSLVQ